MHDHQDFCLYYIESQGSTETPDVPSSSRQFEHKLKEVNNQPQLVDTQFRKNISSIGLPICMFLNNDVFWKTFLHRTQAVRLHLRMFQYQLYQSLTITKLTTLILYLQNATCGKQRSNLVSIFHIPHVIRSLEQSFRYA